MGLRLLVIALIIILTIAVILLTLPHFKPTNHAVTSTANGTVSFTVANVGVNVPIYVVGPSLVNRLIGVGVNQSLIRLVNISQLPLLPNGSVVIVY